MTRSLFKRRLPAVVILGLCWAVHGQVNTATSAQAPAAAEPKHPLEVLLDQIDELQEQIQALRRELATAKLKTADAARELQELRQFIADHHEFGQEHNDDAFPFQAKTSGGGDLGVVLGGSRSGQYCDLGAGSRGRGAQASAGGSAGPD